jgi:hypothetical protein
MQYKKQQALAREIADALRKRLPTKTITESFGTAGFPCITINDGIAATTECNYFIRVRAIDGTLEKDVFGNAAEMFVPSVIQVATEAPAAADYITMQEDLSVMGEILMRGCLVERYQSVNTVVPVEASITGAPVAKFSHLYWTATISS